jgi:hypothetical protein
VKVLIKLPTVLLLKCSRPVEVNQPSTTCRLYHYGPGYFFPTWSPGYFFPTRSPTLSLAPSSLAPTATPSLSPAVTPPSWFQVGKGSCSGCYSCINSTGAVTISDDSCLGISSCAELAGMVSIGSGSCDAGSRYVFSFMILHGCFVFDVAHFLL